MISEYGTLFTLFVVPAVYLLIATAHSREAAPEARQTLPSGVVGTPEIRARHSQNSA